ncbi:Hydroxyacid oxidase 1 [Lamellibrachia satsuma]|nr:Hydroxyacid oxidase 1 [Lamellibrachia satsuma]
MAVSKQMVCLDDFEKYAYENIPRKALDYFRSGANNETTMRDNVDAFRRYQLRPRCLRDVSRRDPSTTVLGHKIAFPVCIASTAMHRMAHPDGEVATAQGARAMGVAFTLSTIATSSIEEIAEGAADGLHFFQMYIYKERAVTLGLLRRAEKNGYKALILTVDTPLAGKRLADDRNQFSLPPQYSMANFSKTSDTGTRMCESEKRSGLNEYINSFFDQSLTWADVRWLKTVTDLPVVVKGVLTAEDAREAIDSGVDGIVVSNHGGRQLDGVPATLDALSEVAAAVGGRCEVYLDGGVRLGTDVLKALALGARAVFIGRPAIYGVAYNGAAGVQEVLQILKSEFDTSMALCGCTTVADIKPSLVAHRQSYVSRL